jgi:transcriptional regulator with XRE-family HTH domain
VRELREERCWSQGHLADAAGLNVRTVQRIESGEPCSFETMMGLAAALGVDVAMLETRRGRRKAAAIRWRLAFAAACVLPVLLFVLVNVLRSVLGISAPFDAMAVAGGKIISFRTFNFVSPFVFVGGGAAACLAALSSFVRVRTKSNGGSLSITALELRSDWPAIGLAVLALCSLAAVVGYAAMEQLFTTLH